MYIADYSRSGYSASGVRKLTVSTGILTTVAGKGSDDYSGNGGQATAAELGFVYAIALDSSGG